MSRFFIHKVLSAVLLMLGSACALICQAALAVWRYAQDSARYIFGDAFGDRVADEILTELRARLPGGMTRNEIRDHFRRNKPSQEIERALALLREHGLIRMQLEETGGRPAERWFAV